MANMQCGFPAHPGGFGELLQLFAQDHHLSKPPNYTQCNCLEVCPKSEHNANIFQRVSRAYQVFYCRSVSTFAFAHYLNRHPSLVVVFYCVFHIICFSIHICNLLLLICSTGKLKCVYINVNANSF